VKKVQANYLRMFLSTQSFLDANAAVWNGTPRMVNYKTMFDKIISRIQAKTESSQQGVGVTQQKKQLKEAIAAKASMLSGILQIIAAEQNNSDLASAVKTSKTDLVRLREADLDAAVKNLISKASENMEALAEFGVTPDVITELTTSVDDFNALIGKPRTILSQKYAALNTIEELFDEGNQILKLNLDNSMLIYRESQTEFYQGFQNARNIIDN